MIPQSKERVDTTVVKYYLTRRRFGVTCFKKRQQIYLINTTQQTITISWTKFLYLINHDIYKITKRHRQTILIIMIMNDNNNNNNKITTNVILICLL